MIATNELHPAGIVPTQADHLAHVTVIDDAGVPVAEADLSYHEIAEASAAILAEEVKLATQYDTEVVKTAEREVREVALVAAAANFALTGAAAKAADPKQAALHFVAASSETARPKSVPTPEKSNDDNDEGTQKVSAADLFGDDEDDDALTQESAKAARDLQLDIEFHTNMSANAKAELAAQDGAAEKATVSFEALVVAMRGLELRATKVANETEAEELRTVNEKLADTLTDAVLHGAVVSHIPRKIKERLNKPDKAQAIAA